MGGIIQVKLNYAMRFIFVLSFIFCFGCVSIQKSSSYLFESSEIDIILTEGNGPGYFIPPVFIYITRSGEFKFDATFCLSADDVSAAVIKSLMFVDLEGEIIWSSNSDINSSRIYNNLTTQLGCNYASARFISEGILNLNEKEVLVIGEIHFDSNVSGEEKLNFEAKLVSKKKYQLREIVY